MADEAKAQSTIVWALTQDSPNVLALANLLDKCKKHGQGRFGNIARYSREGFVEVVLESGINALTNAVEADAQRRSREAYCAAVSNIIPPADATDVKAMTAYAQAVAQLQRKHGIGGTKVPL